MKQSAFSLIELLIVLAITAILATIAVPTYSEYIAKENIKRAQSDLEYLSAQFESRYQRILAHPTSEHASAAALQTIVPNWIPTSNSNDFSFSNENASATSYTVKALGLTGAVKDCTVSLSSDGTKSVSNCADLTTNEQWL